MNLFKTRLAALAVVALIIPNAAHATNLCASSGSLAACADFVVIDANTLSVTLTNTSAADVLIPANILTAVFFDISGVGALTPASALLNAGSTVFFDAQGQPAGGVVGGEWTYGSGLAGAPGGATEGIGSSGFGLFGNANFPGPDLDPPTAVNGFNYGLLSAGDNTTTGNSQVTGDVPLVKNSVVFTLTSTGSFGGTFDLAASLSHVSFQYGTALTEPNIPCCGGGGGESPVPEPASLLLLGTGLGLVARRVRRKKQA